MEPTPQPKKEQPLDNAKKLADYAQIPVTVGGAITAVFAFIQEKPAIFWISIVICVISLIYYFVSKTLKNRKRPILEIPVVNSDGAFLRGLLPFEKGDVLLGRINDIRQILTKVSSSEFRFSYISGEAGSGKTSLVRAGILPELEKRNWLVIYVPKIGIDAKASIRNAIKEKFTNSDNPARNEKSILKLLASVCEQQTNNKVLIICDQFEEFFITNRTLGLRKPLIKEIGELVKDVNPLRVCFLVSLRKEFVDDLQDFKDEVTQPLDARFCHRVRNWETGDALVILNTAAKADNVPFAPGLMRKVIKDLEQAGEVRPVEIQLVATRMHEQGIYDLEKYRNAEGAKGIISSFIKEITEPEGQQTSDLERQVSRHLLRSLCAENTDAKRPEGLTFDEIQQKIKATLKAQGLSHLVDDASRYERALLKIINRCLSAYLIIREDEEKFNLIHDYIVRPVLEATGDIDTVEEQANRLLDQYIDEEKRKSNATIAWRHYSFIKKYASPQRKIEERAIQLFRRTKQVFLFRSSAVFAVLITILTIISPPQLAFKEEESFYLSEVKWEVSQDKRYAVSSDLATGATIIWNLNTDWSNTVLIPINFRGIKISPNSKFIAGITKDGLIYMWRPEEKINEETKPVLSVSVPQIELKRESYFWSDWGAFSPNDDWFYTRSVDGNLYLWKSEEYKSGVIPKPTLKGLFFSDGLNALSGNNSNIEFSPMGRFLTVEDGSGWLAVIRLTPTFLMKNYNFFMLKDPELNKKRIYFSSNDEWAAFTGVDGKVKLSKLNTYPDLIIQTLDLQTPEDTSTSYRRHYEFYFSPNNEWIIAKDQFNYYFVWSLNQFPNIQPYRIPEDDTDLLNFRSRTTMYTPIFSPDSEMAACVSGGDDLNVFRLNKSPATAIKPLLYSHSCSILVFSPDSKWIAARIKNQGIYVWKIEHQPDLLKPVLQTDKDYLSVYINWSTDSKYLYSFFGRDVYIGETNEVMKQLFRADSEVKSITVNASKKLIIFSENRITRVAHKFYLWGIPIYTFDMPELSTN